MAIEFKKGYYSIEDEKGNKTVIYPRTIPECVKVPVKEDEEPKTLQDILDRMKSAASKDVNEIVDPNSDVLDGTATTDRTYSMKAINTAFREINEAINALNEDISNINDPTEEVNQLSNKVDNLSNKVEVLTNAVNNFNKKITTIQNNQEKLSTSISNLESITKMIGENTSSNSDAIRDLRTRVTALESR